MQSKMMGSDIAPKKRKTIEDDDDDDNDDDNVPLAKIANVPKKVKTENKNEGLKKPNRGNGDDNKKDDSDDDVLLFTLTKKSGPLKSSSAQKDASSSSGKDKSDSEDDAPLSSLKKKAVPVPVPVPSSSISVQPANGKIKEESSEEDDVPLVNLNKLKAKEKPKAVKSEPAAAPAPKVHSAKPLSTKVVVKTEGTKKLTTKTNEPSSSQKSAIRYDIPGQKYATPEENDPQRIFYETMYKERKEKGLPNTLAATWVLTHGLLSKDEAFKLLNSTAVKHTVAGPPTKAKGKDSKDINVKVKNDEKSKPKANLNLNPVKQEGGQKPAVTVKVE